MSKPIPEWWRNDVVRILKAGEAESIDWTIPASQRWDADSGGAWPYEALDAISQALQNPDIQGNETTSMSGQIATYEFLFNFQQQTMYGKIALMEGKVAILILSAHRAQRPTL